MSINNEIQAVVSLLLFQHVSASCLGVFCLILPISYLSLHHSCCQNCSLSLSSSKFRLCYSCSHQTFQRYSLQLSGILQISHVPLYRTLCFVMFSIFFTMTLILIILLQFGGQSDVLNRKIAKFDAHQF